eukprot:CFRG2213T1
MTHGYETKGSRGSILEDKDEGVSSVYNVREEQSPRFRHNGRCCWGGMSKLVFIILCAVIALCVLIAIMIPVLFIPVGGALAQSGVDGTVIKIVNQSIVYWGQNYVDSCTSSGSCTAALVEPSTCTISAEPTCTGTAHIVPNVLVMNQTLEFSNVAIPGKIQSGSFQMLYTDENKGDSTAVPTNDSAAILIGDLYAPELDLHGLEDGKTTLYDVEMVLMVRDPRFFTTLGALATAPGNTGIWIQQKGSVILEADLAGTKMYYKADMAAWIYNADLLQCDGPLSGIPSFVETCSCKNDCIKFESH